MRVRKSVLDRAIFDIWKLDIVTIVDRFGSVRDQVSGQLHQAIWRGVFTVLVFGGFIICIWQIDPDEGAEQVCARGE